MTCRRSPSSTSTRSSPAPTARTWSTPGCAFCPPSRPTPTCAGYGDLRLPGCPADAPPGDPARDDAEEQLPVPARPRLDAGLQNLRALGVGFHVVHGALDQDAPSLSCGEVDLVDLEGDLVLGVGDAGTEILICGAVLGGAEPDCSPVQPVVDGEHRRAVPARVRDPADAPRRDQPHAFRLVQVLQHWPPIGGIRHGVTPVRDQVWLRTLA